MDFTFCTKTSWRFRFISSTMALPFFSMTGNPKESYSWKPKIVKRQNYPVRQLVKAKSIVSAINSIQKLYKSVSNVTKSKQSKATSWSFSNLAASSKNVFISLPALLAHVFTLWGNKRKSPHILTWTEISHALKPQLTRLAKVFQLS